MKFYPDTAEKGRKCLNSSGSSEPVLNLKYHTKELDYKRQTNVDLVPFSHTLTQFCIAAKFIITNVIAGRVLCHFPGECNMYHNHIKTTDYYTHDILNNSHHIFNRGTNEQAVEVKNLAS